MEVNNKKYMTLVEEELDGKLNRAITLLARVKNTLEGLEFVGEEEKERLFDIEDIENFLEELKN